MMQPGDDERRGGEAEFSGAHQRGDHDVAPGLQLAVDLHGDAIAQVVHHQHLLRFGEAELPRHAAVLDRGQRRRAGAAVVARDEHDVGVRLGDAGRDRADAGERHELDVDARLGIGVLQVVNELREILDRIDVVVRRRRDQADARRRVADLGNPRIHLVAGQLPAFARLAPCAILICRSSALTRYSLVTPNRADATCLTALRRQSPFGSFL